ncbi:hypothetical protein K450DRAFT_236579 [Umbelopsis ramanniana AG]|uniref:Uncharacterized protein n=1 Tax=Umbelopsis ramanniana AG TaxID=1314678 RepID=A0AAD5EB29_UMBRA|nr:uncharacterized protein K450DRAFT_236579 [Umbelopsis ramanniana AG]KAI8580641.1 hypothetical protein K450DRAFT_236579 [Umbelopsis ramanniana AG]
MTSLRSTFNRFTPELQVRYRNDFEILVKFGIFTVQDLQEYNLDDLAQHTGLSSYTLYQLQQDICHYAARQRCRTAADLWEEEQLPKPQLNLSTGIPSIDATLQSQIPNHQITELYGLQQEDKYHIYLNMLMSLQEEKKNVVAYYVDIQRHFDAQQLQHLYLTSPKYHMYREAGITIENILSRLQCVQCSTAKSLVLFLERTSSTSMVTSGHIQLVFLDACDQLFNIPFSDGGKEMFYLAMTIQSLSLLRADDFTLLLMFHDSAEQHDTILSPAHLPPYVGPAWSFISDKQMMMLSSNNKQTELHKIKIRR